MNIKNTWRVLVFLHIFLLSLASCKDDKDENPVKPVINLKEVGSNNSKKVNAGSDLHLTAAIFAEGVIQKISVEIESKNGGSTHIEKSYTDSKYTGVKNAEFHEHIDILDGTPEGKYNLRFTVTDKFGQSTTVESELTIEVAPVNISIDGLTFGAGHDFPDNKIGYLGTAPVVDVKLIKAENGIDKIEVVIHSEGSTAPFEIKASYTFEGEKEIEKFHRHIQIPRDAPVGDYHMHFKVYDKQGKMLERALDIEIKATGIAITDIEIGDNNTASVTDVHTEFKVKATDPLSRIRVRIYKADAPREYFYNTTFADDFASGNIKEYTFHKHLVPKDAAPGEYLINILMLDNKGAYEFITEKLTLK